jgi:tetratricopeptide (TPR) repeat protein
MRQLLKEFAGRRSRWLGPGRILVVGRCERMTELLHEDREANPDIRETLSERLRLILRYRGEDRFAEFQRQWARFSRHRGQIRSEESGSRMRRAATYYASHTEDLVPISIRLRALFASNEATAAYLDPTQGFIRLAGPNFRDFADVTSYYSDVTDYIGHVRFNEFKRDAKPKKSSRRHYLLQFASTAKHWLTEDALEALLEIKGAGRQAKLEKAKEKMFGLSPIVREKWVEVEGRRRSRYFASMAIKAVVQDDWIKDDPYARSVAHYGTAKRLKDNENNKQALVWEFPYGPHWGRSRIFFLSETIRHLVRSSETFVGESAPLSLPDVARFPDYPRQANFGTDPRQVINYCYEVLYQRELNGTTGAAAGRALAKRYGAYQLAVELLQLMSENCVIGIPHPQLKAERRGEFIRECGFALLDIGDLPKAKGCFTAAERELENTSRRIEAINAILDSTLVDSASGNAQDAATSLERARREINELHGVYVRDEVPKTEYRLLRQLQRRFLTREAHLAYLTGDHDLARDRLDQIERKQRWPHGKASAPSPRDVLVPSFKQRLEAEQTHLLVAVLQKGDPPENRKVEGSPSSIALNRCLEAMLLAHSEGLNHQAMGFRIALARCFRRQGMLATGETMLDAVHLDLLRYGCSERTFLSFLNEAGRVLCARGDPIRAYATYLHPCIGRAKAHGFLRDAAQAAAQAATCLKDVRRLCEENMAAAKEGSWRAALDEAKSNHRKLISSVEDVAQDDLFGRDPLFAYAVADAQRVIDDLASCEEIDRHIADVERELSEFTVKDVPA